MTDQHHAGPDPARGRGAGSGAATAPDEEPPRLRRDRRHKLVGGVCAGLGRHCDIDPLIFRIVLSVLAVTGGLGLIGYGVAWLFVPLDGEDENEARRLLSGRVDGPALTAVLCKLVGTGLFLSMMRNTSVLTFALFLTLLLAATAQWSRRRVAAEPGDPGEPAPSGAGAPPEAQAPPAPDGPRRWWREPIVKDGTHVGGTGYLWGPDGTGPAPGGTHQPGPEPPRPRWLGGWVLLLALAAAAVGTGLTWDRLHLGPSLQTGLAAALAVFGLGIAVSSRYGRTGGGSLLLALTTAALLAGAAALPSNITTDWHEPTWRPASAAQVRPSYALGSGDAVLDLRQVRVDRGRTLSTAAEVGAGRLRVVVPEGTTVRVRAEVKVVGDIQVPGEARKDVDVATGRTERTVLRGDGSRGTLDLRLEVGLGQLEVTRAAP